MSIFDIMGPVMIGPSSSHTAGAVKLGKLAGLIFKDKIKEIMIDFHGSFAETYIGHGTDRAIVGGILGFDLDDERIKQSLRIAGAKGIKVLFSKIDLRNVHPNTAIIQLKNEKKELKITGYSIGGGDIVVHEVDGYQVDLTGKLPALWVLHRDQPGEIATITTVLSKHELNIAYMKVFREEKGLIGSSIIELDQEVIPEVVTELETYKDIIQVKYIPKL